MIGLNEGDNMLQGLGAIRMHGKVAMCLLSFVQGILDAHAYLFLSAFKRKMPVSMSQQ
jgi:hypothetical protein